MSESLAIKKDEYACIIIGDEILDGHVKESNLQVLVSCLYPIGYRLKEVRIISDEMQSIEDCINDLRKRYCFVVTIGGLGATHDDITMAAYAKSFNQKLSLHKEMYDFFHRRPRPTKEMEESAIRMSTLPEGMELVQIDNRWPLLKLENCFALPGLPRICGVTIEKLMSILPKQERIFYRECYVNIYEHQYFMWLQEVAKKWGTTAIGSYPISEHDKAISKISVTSRDEKAVEQCFEEIHKHMEDKGVLVSAPEAPKSAEAVEPPKS